METCDVMPETKTTRDRNAAPRMAGGVTQVTGQSVRQTDTHARVPRPPAVHRFWFHTWALGRQLRIVLYMQPCCPGAPPTQEDPAGGPVSGPWPASPDRVGWASQLPACTHQIQVCVPGSFPRTVPCLRAGAKFIRGSQVLNTNFQSWHDCGSSPRSGLRVLCAEYSQEAAYMCEGGNYIHRLSRCPRPTHGTVLSSSLSIQRATRQCVHSMAQ